MGSYWKRASSLPTRGSKNLVVVTGSQLAVTQAWHERTEENVQANLSHKETQEFGII